MPIPGWTIDASAEGFGEDTRGKEIYQKIAERMVLWGRRMAIARAALVVAFVFVCAWVQSWNGVPPYFWFFTLFLFPLPVGWFVVYQAFRIPGDLLRAKHGEELIAFAEQQIAAGLPGWSHESPQERRLRELVAAAKKGTLDADAVNAEFAATASPAEPAKPSAETADWVSVAIPSGLAEDVAVGRLIEIGVSDFSPAGRSVRVPRSEEVKVREALETAVV